MPGAPGMVGPVTTIATSNPLEMAPTSGVSFEVLPPIIPPYTQPPSSAGLQQHPAAQQYSNGHTATPTETPVARTEVAIASQASKPAAAMPPAMQQDLKASVATSLEPATHPAADDSSAVGVQMSEGTTSMLEPQVEETPMEVEKEAVAQPSEQAVPAAEDNRQQSEPHGHLGVGPGVAMKVEGTSVEEGMSVGEASAVDPEIQEQQEEQKVQPFQQQDPVAEVIPSTVDGVSGVLGEASAADPVQQPLDQPQRQDQPEEPLHQEQLEQPPQQKQLEQPPHQEQLHQPPQQEQLEQLPQHLDQPPQQEQLEHLPQLDQPPPQEQLNQPPQQEVYPQQEDVDVAMEVEPAVSTSLDVAGTALDDVEAQAEQEYKESIPAATEQMVDAHGEASAVEPAEQQTNAAVSTDVQLPVASMDEAQATEELPKQPELDPMQEAAEMPSSPDTTTVEPQATREIDQEESKLAIPTGVDVSAQVDVSRATSSYEGMSGGLEYTAIATASASMDVEEKAAADNNSQESPPVSVLAHSEGSLQEQMDSVELVKQPNINLNPVGPLAGEDTMADDGMVSVAMDICEKDEDGKDS